MKAVSGQADEIHVDTHTEYKYGSTINFSAQIQGVSEVIRAAVFIREGSSEFPNVAIAVLSDGSTISAEVIEEVQALGVEPWIMCPSTPTLQLASFNQAYVWAVRHGSVGMPNQN